MKSQVTEVDLVRKELLLMDARVLHNNSSKYGIAFVLNQREQSNAPKMVRQRREVDSKCLISVPNKQVFPSKKFSSKANIDTCSPSNIKRMLISKKKFERNRRMTGIFKNNAIKKEAESKAKLAKNSVKNALNKIHSFGLLMKSLRGTRVNKRAKSAGGKKRTRNVFPIGYQKAEQAKTHEPEEIPKVTHSKRKKSILQVYETITSFVKTLLKDTKNSDESLPMNKFTAMKPVSTRRRSSYYSNISEGSLTEEDIN